VGATTSGRWDKRGAGGRRAAGVAAGLAVLAGGAVLGLGGGAAARAGVPAGAAGSDARPWLAVESSVFGPAASTTWRGVRASDQELGGVAREAGEGGRGDTGRKVKAGLLSLILPGAGQFYNGDQQKAYIFAGVEAAVWASYLTFDVMGDHRAEDYREYAGIYADAGPSGSDQYWRAVGRYMDSDAYNESILREARSYGVEPAGANCMQESLRQGKVVDLPSVNTRSSSSSTTLNSPSVSPTNSQRSVSSSTAAVTLA